MAKSGSSKSKSTGQSSSGSSSKKRRKKTSDGRERTATASSSRRDNGAPSEATPAKSRRPPSSSRAAPRPSLAERGRSAGTSETSSSERQRRRQQVPQQQQQRPAAPVQPPFQSLIASPSIERMDPADIPFPTEYRREARRPGAFYHPGIGRQDSSSSDSFVEDGFQEEGGAGESPVNDNNNNNDLLVTATLVVEDEEEDQAYSPPPRPEPLTNNNDGGRSNRVLWLSLKQIDNKRRRWLWMVVGIIGLLIVAAVVLVVVFLFLLDDGGDNPPSTLAPAQAVGGTTTSPPTVAPAAAPNQSPNQAPFFYIGGQFGAFEGETPLELDLNAYERLSFHAVYFGFTAGGCAAFQEGFEAHIQVTCGSGLNDNRYLVQLLADSGTMGMACHRGGRSNSMDCFPFDASRPFFDQWKTYGGVALFACAATADAPQQTWFTAEIIDNRLLGCTSDVSSGVSIGEYCSTTGSFAAATDFSLFHSVNVNCDVGIPISVAGGPEITPLTSCSNFLACTNGVGAGCGDAVLPTVQMSEQLLVNDGSNFACFLSQKDSSTGTFLYDSTAMISKALNAFPAHEYAFHLHVALTQGRR